MDNNSLIWFIAGIFFLLTEIFLPGFIIFFFGIGGLVTSLLTYIFNIESIFSQIVIFITSSLLSLVFLRRTFSNLFRGKVSGDKVLEDEFIGKKAVVIHEIVPDSLNGKVEFNGTNWEAKSDSFIDKGTVVEIIKRKDLKLIVKPLE